MKKKTLLSLLAACLFALSLGSCCFFYDDYGYEYRHHDRYYDHYNYSPSWRSSYNGGGVNHHHGPSHR